jgi:ubiquinone/menaquinone biosynthesis C-methylase UbiE
MATQSAHPEYVLGRSEKESQRLVKQSHFMRPSTERVFRKAGIADGMRVLDTGCGAGDVSFLVSELVGTSGTVVGIDRDPAMLVLARERAREAGLSNITFEESEVGGFTTTQPFDAVVGRFILMYQADPVLTLINLSRAVKNKGLIVFQEPDFGVGVTAWPPVALWDNVKFWCAETFRRGGVHHDIGGKLYHLFRKAGLPGPALLQHISVAGGDDTRPFCENIAGIVSSMLPRMEKFGIATAAEVQVETLADRLVREICAAEAQVTYMPAVAAWTTVG